MTQFTRALAALCIGSFAACGAWALEARQDEYAAAWGPALGTPAPRLEATDQDGVARDFADLRGENGLLVLFSRSVDW